MLCRLRLCRRSPRNVVIASGSVSEGLASSPDFKKSLAGAPRLAFAPRLDFGDNCACSWGRRSTSRCPNAALVSPSMAPGRFVEFSGGQRQRLVPAIGKRPGRGSEAAAALHPAVDDRWAVADRYI